MATRQSGSSTIEIGIHGSLNGKGVGKRKIFFEAEAVGQGREMFPRFPFFTEVTWEKLKSDVEEF